MVGFFILIVWVFVGYGFYVIFWYIRRLFWEGLSGLVVGVLLCLGEMRNWGIGIEWFR